MEEVNILGIKVNKVTMKQTLELVEQWAQGSKKRYIVTPNIEIIMAAQDNKQFAAVLNEADLAIPDSGRLGWAVQILNEKNPLKKAFYWPFFTLPKLGLIKPFPVVTGTDLVEEIAREFNNKDLSIGLIGGRNGIADKAAKCLKERYPNLKIVFVSDGPSVRENGETEETQKDSLIYKDISGCSVLFVAFGHSKQEFWIKKHLNEIDAKVFVGVGGAFDYVSGNIPRAPKFLRDLGLEWLYRLIIQPWRIKRFGSLIKFVFLVAKS